MTDKTKLDPARYGVEIKCPRPRQHLKNIETNCKQYRKQVQGSLWLTGADYWYIVSYCPWVTEAPLHIVRVERNQTMIDEIREAAVTGADEVDALEARIRDRANASPKAEAIHAQAEHARKLWEDVQTLNGVI